MGINKIVYHFNSIKVQLRQRRKHLETQKKKFQFHKGTIKTQAIKEANEAAVSFQFHKGTIKTFV